MNTTDPAIPAGYTLFDPVSDAYGSRLALVFGNENDGGACPFYGHQCFHCDIGAGEGVQFDGSANLRRLEYFQERYREVLPQLRHLVLYNSGSTLNPRELSSETLRAVLAFAASLPECRVVSLDSREIYVRPAALEVVADSLRPDQGARIILGLETQDDRLRMEVLRKKMSRRAIESAFKALAETASRVHADVNIVIQPPGVVDDAAVREAVDTADYSLELGLRHGVLLDLNIHPYYPSEIGSLRFPSHPRAAVGTVLEALWQIRALQDRHPTPSNLFVGWQDEAHDQEQSTRNDELDRFLAVFDQLNRDQDREVLRKELARVRSGISG